MFSPSFVKFGFSFRFYRPLVICGQAPFLNELIKANQRTNFHFFSIIIDLESPEIITKWFDWDWEKKQRLVAKVGFWHICEYLMNDLIDSINPRGKVAQNKETY